MPCPASTELTLLQLSGDRGTRKAVSPLHWGQIFPSSREVRRKSLELFEVES